MDLQTIVKNIDAKTAQAFVTATRHVIDAMLIEAQRVHQTQTPSPKDYNHAPLSREAAPGGWLSHTELRETARQLSEAVAAEKWTDGVLFALKALSVMGGVL
ncbi:MAG: hypothetical protein KAY37_09920 [Phycisphaerae bacterium]|nr:hypothetical protein [Phycisphaerae bacterium]